MSNNRKGSLTMKYEKYVVISLSAKNIDDWKVVFTSAKESDCRSFVFLNVNDYIHRGYSLGIKTAKELKL